MDRPVDKTKKSNIKCEHCKYYNYDRSYCGINPKVNLSKDYWNRCEKFEWE